MRVSVVGTGYVGLVSGACLADVGHHVVCVDIDEAKVARIESGESPIHEPGLDELLERNAGGRLRATTDLAAAVIGSDLTLVAVGTPFDGHEIDLTQVIGATREIGEILRNKAAYHAVVVKSTVVPGTTDLVVLPTLEEASGKHAGIDFGVGINPEFLSEGDAVRDFMNPDRIVLGGSDNRAIDAQVELYRPFAAAEVLKVNNTTAEMIKYASNAFQATLISFSNEIGNLCAAIGGTDVVDVMHGVHLSRILTPVLANGERVWPGVIGYLMAGCGFGGSCFPKDLKALAAFGDKVGSELLIARAVIDTNQRQPLRLVQLVQEGLVALEGKRVAVLGLAFKPGTDDVRESPAIPVIRELRARGAEVRAYDPVANEAASAILGDDVRYVPDLAAALDGVDAVVIVTSWDEFRELPELLAGQRPAPLLVDGRRMIEKSAVERYAGIGW